MTGSRAPILHEPSRPHSACFLDADLSYLASVHREEAVPIPTQRHRKRRSPDRPRRFDANERR